MGNFQQEKGKIPSQTIQNPQGQNSVGVSGLSDCTFEHCKVVTTLRSGKIIDKAIHPKETIQDVKNEPFGDDEVSDKPHFPRADVVDVEPKKRQGLPCPSCSIPSYVESPQESEQSFLNL